ncbi:hypothetical protein [Mesorhizobium dulcispinae]|uniref:hypothetical protein n=1 Tax=Mesorhizobium dulcispinae TaxID=3072316 RepID=UPI002A24C96C|nr:hypothetical protein [Mesorhizobium sp. VK23D]MDX8520695.1 hypothetical protein [Mesorhizobium sp. VK23D]
MADMQGAQHWNENNSRSFLDYGRYFVPERERQIDMIADLIPAAPGGLLVEFCSGEGLLSRTLWGRCPPGHKGGAVPPALNGSSTPKPAFALSASWLICLAACRLRG